MKFKKITCTLAFAAFAVLAYTTFDVVKAETTANSQEVSPFATTTTESKLQLDDIQPAVLMDMKPEIKELVKQGSEIEDTVKESVQKVENTVKENVKEVENTVKEEVKELKNDVTIIKQAVPEAIPFEEKILENTNKAVETVKEEASTVEVKRELPVLEDIKLPEVTPKATNNEPVKIEVSSQRIPVGTVIPLKLESPVNSLVSNMGDQFNATLTSDIMIGDNIVLPAGSVVRGTIGKMQKAGMFVREAKIMLIFDHIVTPAGKQIPMYAYMTGNENTNYEGYIVGGTSYLKSFKKDAAKGKDIIVNTTTYGVDTGLKYLAGVPVVLTAPLCAIGGTLGGGGYIVGKSVYNMFNRGNEVLLEPGTILNITLSKALDIPVN